MSCFEQGDCHSEVGNKGMVARLVVEGGGTRLGSSCPYYRAAMRGEGRREMGVGFCFYFVLNDWYSSLVKFSLLWLNHGQEWVFLIIFWCKV